MDAKTIASLPPKLLAQYLRDPQLQMAMQYQQEGADTSPVQHWTQGAARLVKGLLGGIQANGIQEQYGKQAQNAATERQMALSQALGRPAETQQVGDRTINWQAQQPNLMSAAANLQSPDNADLAEKFLGAQLSQNQTAQNQAFQQAQQERLFQQQQAMVNAQLEKQMAFERYKLENDPKRQFAKQWLAQQGQGTAPQPQGDITAPPTPGQLPAGIQLDQTRQQATAQPAPAAAQGNDFDPRATMLAQMALDMKLPEGYGLDARMNPVKLPRKLSPTEQKELFDSIDMIKSADMGLGVLAESNKVLNGEAKPYSGFGAETMAAANRIPVIGALFDDKRAAATTQMANLANTQVVESIKQALGGSQLSNQDVLLMQKLQALPSYQPQEQQAIINFAIQRIKQRREMNLGVARGIQTGSYRNTPIDELLGAERNTHPTQAAPQTTGFDIDAYLKQQGLQ